MVVLRERSESEFVYQRRQSGLHVGPEPGRAEIKAVLGGQATLIDGQNAPSQAIPRLEQFEIQPGSAQKFRAV
jgi:hypothetical protein